MQSSARNTKFGPHAPYSRKLTGLRVHIEFLSSGQGVQNEHYGQDEYCVEEFLKYAFVSLRVSGLGGAPDVG